MTDSDLPPTYNIKIELDPNNQQPIEIGEVIRGRLCIDTSHPIATQGIYVDLSYDLENYHRLESRRVNSVHILSNGLSAGTHFINFSIDLMDIESNSDTLPISYHGKLFDINWSINARIDIAHALDIKAKQTFTFISKKTRTLRQLEKSHNLNRSNIVAAFIFAVVFSIVIGAMIFIFSQENHTSWFFYAVIFVLTLLVARLLKNTVPSMWQQRKLGQVFIEVIESDLQTQQVQGHINITPKESLVLDQVEVVLQRIEEVEIYTNEKSELLYFAKDIASSKTDKTISLNKLKTTSLPFTLTPPTDLISTLQLKNHQISWSIQVRIKSCDITFEGGQAIDITLGRVFNSNDTL